MKHYFACDYHEGAHPLLMRRLLDTNLEQTPGYGEDDYCRQAARQIRRVCGDETLDVHFLVGGTQTNVTVIDAALRPHQAVISADTGHINVHETGAVEASGHKVLTVPGTDGRLSAAQVEAVCLAHGDEHVVQPKMVYLSSPTELGSVYRKAELRALRDVCDRFGLFLFLDGARMGYGLAAEENDLTLPEIAACCDVFSIGGTKVGALFGEAVVIRSVELKPDFRYAIKQNGGLLAKGRLLGVQFLMLFEPLAEEARNAYGLPEGGTLYEAVSAHAVAMAGRVRGLFGEAGYRFWTQNGTNQIFPILPEADLRALEEQGFVFQMQEKLDGGRAAVRVCTSWATREEAVAALGEALRELRRN